MKDLKLQQLFTEQLRDFYGAEVQLAAFFPQLRDAANNEMLKEVLSDHIQMVEKQIDLLRRVFENLGESAEGEAGPAVQGMLQEGEAILADSSPEVLDAALIILAQKIHHYEMASYGSLVTLATELGDPQTAELLRVAEPQAIDIR